jgi:hypothetical protein
MHHQLNPMESVDIFDDTDPPSSAPEEVFLCFFIFIFILAQSPCVTGVASIYFFIFYFCVQLNLLRHWGFYFFLKVHVGLLAFLVWSADDMASAVTFFLFFFSLHVMRMASSAQTTLLAQ